MSDQMKEALESAKVALDLAHDALVAQPPKVTSSTVYEIRGAMNVIDIALSSSPPPAQGSLPAGESKPSVTSAPGGGEADLVRAIEELINRNENPCTGQEFLSALNGARAALTAYRSRK